MRLLFVGCLTAMMVAPCAFAETSTESQAVADGANDLVATEAEVEAETNQFTHAIPHAIDQFEKGVLKQNAAEVAALYTRDATLMIDGFPTFIGTAGIKNFWAGAFASGLKTIDLRTKSLRYVSGSQAIEVGDARLSFRPTGKKAFIQTGRYQVIWVRTSVGWRMIFDMTNNTVNTPIK